MGLGYEKKCDRVIGSGFLWNFHSDAAAVAKARAGDQEAWGRDATRRVGQRRVTSRSRRGCRAGDWLSLPC